VGHIGKNINWSFCVCKLQMTNKIKWIKAIKYNDKINVIAVDGLMVSEQQPIISDMQSCVDQHGFFFNLFIKTPYSTMGVNLLSTLHL